MRRVRRCVNRKLSALLCSCCPWRGPLRVGLYRVALCFQSSSRPSLLLASDWRSVLRLATPTFAQGPTRGLQSATRVATGRLLGHLPWHVAGRLERTL